MDHAYQFVNNRLSVAKITIIEVFSLGCVDVNKEKFSLNIYHVVIKSVEALFNDTLSYQLH